MEEETSSSEGGGSPSRRGVRRGVKRGRYRRSPNEDSKRRIIDAANREDWRNIAKANGVSTSTAYGWINTNHPYTNRAPWTMKKIKQSEQNTLKIWWRLREVASRSFTWTKVIAICSWEEPLGDQEKEPVVRSRHPLQKGKTSMLLLLYAKLDCSTKKGREGLS